MVAAAVEKVGEVGHGGRRVAGFGFLGFNEWWWEN